MEKKNEGQAKTNKFLIGAIDLITLPFSLLPGFIAWAASIYMVFRFASMKKYFLISLFPFVLPLVFILCIFLMRLILPRLKPGFFAAPFSKGFIVWFFHIVLNRAIRISLLQSLIHSSGILKYLYWKALGANIAFGINSSLIIYLVDLQLITIEEGCMIGDESMISCHIFVGNKIMIYPVHIKKNTVIGMRCFIGAKTTIGENCRIGIFNNIINKTILDNTKIENFEYFTTKSTQNENLVKDNDKESTTKDVA